MLFGEKEESKHVRIILIPGINFTPTSLPLAPSIKKEHVPFYLFIYFNGQLTTPVSSSLYLLKHVDSLPHLNYSPLFSNNYEYC